MPRAHRRRLHPNKAKTAYFLRKTRQRIRATNRVTERAELRLHRRNAPRENRGKRQTPEPSDAHLGHGEVRVRSLALRGVESVLPEHQVPNDDERRQSPAHSSKVFPVTGQVK